MEKDKEFESLQRWYVPISKEEDLAVQYLTDMVKDVLMTTREGVYLSDVIGLLRGNNLTAAMVRAVGFETVPHFLFHLEHVLEVRGKKINGRIFYFLFVKKELQLELRKAGQQQRLDPNKKWGKVDTGTGGVLYETSFPAAFSVILNPFRGLAPVKGSSGKNKFAITHPLPRQQGQEGKVKPEFKGTMPMRTHPKKVELEKRPANNNCPNKSGMGKCDDGSSDGEGQRVLRTVVFDDPNQPLRQYRIYPRNFVSGFKSKYRSVSRYND